MKTTLSEAARGDALRLLAEVDLAHARVFPGDRAARQPIHTVYGGAHLFRADAAAKLGALARSSLDSYAPDAATFARALGLPEPSPWPQAEALYARVRAKLEAEPETFQWGRQALMSDPFGNGFCLIEWRNGGYAAAAGCA